jgi:undecaprenyl-diphosphatase
MAAAFAVAAVAAYLVIGWLLAWLERRGLTVFVVYRIALGIAILALALAV